MKRNSQYHSLVTGASSGLGKSFAIELARRGKNVLLVSHPNEGLGNLCESLKTEYGVEAHYYEVDLANLDELLTFTGWVNRKFSINILINKLL